ncbi:MAG: enoyl-ACP reductase FabI [Chloroflexaceae bacterium]|nr:enoyl-ACP reductase FabI [Chloroflexaceae bacterium]NJL33113.1 enoyl-ACP reductase FabI [Chloroflexaceae bacterium]NJO04114.1 enoyl-ACP reductase FabI [Chloroflexaceae bacterium]
MGYQLDLTGKKALVVGIANEHSIAYAAACAFRELGADLAITYLNEKAEKYVRPLAEQLEASIIMPLDVNVEGQLEAAFDVIAQQWGRLDILLHSIAFAPKEDLHGRVVDTSKAGFALAMDISCHSFIRMAHLAEPLMKEHGGSMMTVTFYGSQRVVDTYNMMGPVKAALEAVVREVASEMGESRIRVNAISPGPILTRAASGITHFDSLLEETARRAPQRSLINLEDIGGVSAFLASDLSDAITGAVIYVDNGANIIA